MRRAHRCAAMKMASRAKAFVARTLVEKKTAQPQLETCAFSDDRIRLMDSQLSINLTNDRAADQRPGISNDAGVEERINDIFERWVDGVEASDRRAAGERVNDLQ